MEQRIEPISADGAAARLQLPSLAEIASTSAPGTARTPAPANVPPAATGSDTWERGPSEPAPVFPPMAHMRARIAAAMNAESAAASGMDLLSKAADSTQELSKILGQLSALVGADGSGSAELQRMRIQVEQLLNQLRFQQGGSIDGSTLGDALRADMETDQQGSQPSSQAAA